MSQNLESLLDPFSPGSAKKLKIWRFTSYFLLDATGLLHSDQIPIKYLQNFILKGIKVNENDAISFFRPIKNPDLITGLKNKVQEAPIRHKLKKDKQASDSLIGKKCYLRRYMLPYWDHFL